MAKARNGEGSITSRKTKTRGVLWDVQLTVHDRRGVAHRMTKRGFESQRAATAWRDEQNRKAKAGRLLRPKPLTVPDVCHKYIAQARIAPTTVNGYTSVLKCHIAPRFDVRVDRVDGKRMQAFMDQTHDMFLVRGKTGSGTVKQARRLVMAALNWAARRDVGLIEANPLFGVKLEDPTRETRRRPFSPAELRRLMEASDGQESQLLWRLILDTGCRRSEATGIDWEDLDLEQRTAHIHRIAEPANGGQTVVERLKSGLERTAPLSEALCADLRAEREARGGITHGHVFPGPRGGPIRSNKVAKWWYRDLEKAGLQGRHIHELRHTWANTALSNGVDPNVVAQILGHTVTTALKHYRHVSLDEMRAASEKVANVLAS